MLVQRKILFGLGMDGTAASSHLFTTDWLCEARREATHKLAEGVSELHKCHFRTVTQCFEVDRPIAPECSRIRKLTRNALLETDPLLTCAGP